MRGRRPCEIDFSLTGGDSQASRRFGQVGVADDDDTIATVTTHSRGGVAVSSGVGATPAATAKTIRSGGTRARCDFRTTCSTTTYTTGSRLTIGEGLRVAIDATSTPASVIHGSSCDKEGLTWAPSPTGLGRAVASATDATGATTATTNASCSPRIRTVPAVTPVARGAQG